MTKVKLSLRVRPDCEVAPWVQKEIIALERELDAAYAELSKQLPMIRRGGIFDRDVWNKVKEYRNELNKQ